MASESSLNGWLFLQKAKNDWLFHTSMTLIALERDVTKWQLVLKKSKNIYSWDTHKSQYTIQKPQKKKTKTYIVENK